MAALTNHNPEVYNTNASFVYSDKFTSPVLGLLDAKPGEVIADLGCGSGELTARIRDAVGPSGRVVGVDSSPRMLEKARATLSGVTFVEADIQCLTDTLDPALKGTFDAVFSSATFHWCKQDPAGVIDGVMWLLKPGGRIAFEFGGFGNISGVRGAIHHVLRSRGHDAAALDPWYFPTVQQYSQLLESRGMSPSNLHLVPRPSPLDTDFIGWLHTFARSTAFATFSDKEAEEMMLEVEKLVAPDCYWSDDQPGAAGQGERADGTAEQKGKSGWELMYVRLRGTATSPA